MYVNETCYKTGRVRTRDFTVSEIFDGHYLFHYLKDRIQLKKGFDNKPLLHLLSLAEGIS